MIITKIMLFLLFLAIFNVIREVFYFWTCFHFKKVHKLSAWRRFGLWTSYSLILTTIILGL